MGGRQTRCLATPGMKTGADIERFDLRIDFDYFDFGAFFRLTAALRLPRIWPGIQRQATGMARSGGRLGWEGGFG